VSMDMRTRMRAPLPYANNDKTGKLSQGQQRVMSRPAACMFVFVTRRET
jgi:hypothetical protein